MMQTLRMTPSRCRPIFCSKNRPKARSQVIVSPRSAQPLLAWLVPELARRRERSGTACRTVSDASWTGYGLPEQRGNPSMPLTIALGNYGLTKPMKQAGVRSWAARSGIRRGRADRADDAADVPGPGIRHLRDGVHHLCLRPRRRPAVHRHPGVRDAEFPPLGDLPERQRRHPRAEGPRGPQGRRQPRLHRHHRVVGARRAAKRIRRRPEQGDLHSDRRRARAEFRRSRRTSTTATAASR